jgi:hypothetical protein
MMNAEYQTISPLPFEGVSQLCFEVVAAIFRWRKPLEFNKPISQAKACGYKKPNYDMVSLGRGEGEGEVKLNEVSLRAPMKSGRSNLFA